MDAGTASTLKDLGLAGYVIGGMASTILALAGANVVQWRIAGKLASKTQAERLAERDILTAAVNSSARAVEAIVKSSDARNNVTEDLADAISNWSSAMEVIKERLAMQHENNTEKLKDIKDVVGSFSEAVRTLTAMVTEVRNYQLRQQARRDQ